MIAETLRCARLVRWAGMLAGVLVIGGGTPARAATPVFVDGAGLCAGLTPCFTTIQVGIKNAGPAPAVVNVFPGTYAESVDLGLMGMAIAGSPGDLVLRTVDSAGRPAPGTASILPAAGPALTNSGMFPGNITIAGFTVKSLDDAGISLSLKGTLTVTGVVSDGNANEGLSASITNGDVHLSASSFSDALSGSGIIFTGPTDVTFDQVTADGNKGNGANFSMTGTLVISRSSFSQNTNGNGLVFSVPVDVTFDAVVADGNQSTGANISMSGVLRISHSSFSNAINGGGLTFGSPSDVTFDHVTADDNQNDAASFGMSGALRISWSSFSNTKNGRGLNFGSPGDVTFDHVTANGNQNDGASFGMMGALRISGSSFSNAKNGGGLNFGTPGDVTFDAVVADGNQNAGASFAMSGILLIANSSFSNAKNGDGLSFSAPTDVTFESVVVDGNSGDGVSTLLGNARVTGSRFDNNGGIGLRLSPASADAIIVLSCNDIAGNMTGLRLSAVASVDARHNYWGAPSGPTTPNNPGGTGDTLIDGSNGGSGMVEFQPFLTVPSAQSAFCNRGAPALDSWGLAVLALGLLVLPGLRLARRGTASSS